MNKALFMYTEFSNPFSYLILKYDYIAMDHQASGKSLRNGRQRLKESQENKIWGENKRKESGSKKQT